MSQPEISLDEAANIAQQLVKHFRAFQKMAEVIEIVRGLEGRKAELERVNQVMAERHNELGRMIDDRTDALAQAEAQHEMQVKHLATQLEDAKRDMELALNNYREAHTQARNNVVLEHSQIVQDIEDTTAKMQNSLLALTAEVEHLEERKRAIRDELKGLLTSQQEAS